MTFNKFLLTICFISITAFASAQEKGYYSIGNNAEKLKVTVEDKAADSFFRPEKGYYAMEINRKKLRRSLVNLKGIEMKVPVIKKGYYSIGNNAAQLDKRRE